MQEKSVQLQSILLPDAAVCDVEELYYHRNGDRIDFNGYFNLFYIEKRKRYTYIRNLSLSVRLKGYQTLILVHDGKDIEKVELKAEKLKDYRILFPYGKYQDGCFWFALVGEEAETPAGSSEPVPDGAACIKTDSNIRNRLPQDKTDRTVSGFYITELAADRIRDVHIGTVICTYRREVYVERNLRQLKERVLERTELDVSSRVKLYIIDNGRTLNSCEGVQKLTADCGERIEILPNKNAGGAGGFTRGMIEVLKAKEQEGFTHVLLMDDDAVFEPDAFVRIHGLAATLKEKWKDITIGGAMLREDFPYILHCAGEIWSGGWITVPEKNLDLRRYANASHKYLTGTDMEHRVYSGWWCCCFSMGTVREDNLPLPLFIHHDDIEYGLRNRDKGIVFLNGVSIWHAGADTRFRGANLYYDIRNNLIEIALHQERWKTLTAAKILLRASASVLVRMKYLDVDLIYRGFKDFMKGPGWLLKQDPEELDQEVRTMSYRMMPLGDIRGQLTEEEYRDVQKQIQQKQICQKCCLVMYDKQTFRKRVFRRQMFHVVTPSDMPFDSLFCGKLLLYEPSSGKATIIRCDYKELFRSLGLCVGVMAETRNFRFLEEIYKKRFLQMKNIRFWKKYLEMK